MTEADKTILSFGRQSLDHRELLRNIWRLKMEEKANLDQSIGQRSVAEVPIKSEE